MPTIVSNKEPLGFLGGTLVILYLDEALILEFQWIKISTGRLPVGIGDIMILKAPRSDFKRIAFEDFF